MFDIVLINGPYNAARARIKRQPDYILVGGKHYYARIDDPETGESLDAYAYDR